MHTQQPWERVASALPFQKILLDHQLPADDGRFNQSFFHKGGGRKQSKSIDTLSVHKIFGMLDQEGEWVIKSQKK